MSEPHIATAQERTSRLHQVGYAIICALVIAVGLGIGSFIGLIGSLLTGIIPFIC